MNIDFQPLPTVPPDRLKQIEAALIADLKPVRPLASTGVYFAAFAGIFVAICIVGRYVAGEHGWHALSELQRLAVFVPLVATSASTQPFRWSVKCGRLRSTHELARFYRSSFSRSCCQSWPFYFSQFRNPPLSGMVWFVSEPAWCSQYPLHSSFHCFCSAAPRCHRCLRVRQLADWPAWLAWPSSKSIAPI